MRQGNKKILVSRKGAKVGALSAICPAATGGKDGRAPSAILPSRFADFLDGF